MRTPATLVFLLAVLACGCATDGEADPRCKRYERARVPVREAPPMPTVQKAASGIWISRGELLRYRPAATRGTK